MKDEKQSNEYEQTKHKLHVGLATDLKLVNLVNDMTWLVIWSRNFDLLNDII